MTKTCQRCGHEFDAQNSSAKYCYSCRDKIYCEYHRQWYLKNRERLLGKRRQWYLENRERLLEYYRQRYIKSKLAVLRGVSK